MGPNKMREVCGHEDCPNKLYSNNTIGYCGSHRRPSSRLPPKICEYENCAELLRIDNNIGYCRPHRYFSLSYKQENYIRNQDPDRKRKRNDWSKIWKSLNRDKVNSWANDWKNNNPEKFRAIIQKKTWTRRARKLNQFIEIVDPLIVWERDKGICYLCGRICEENNYHLDHKNPLSKGGEHSYDNVAITHPTCNLKKGSKLPSEIISTSVV